jgi:hypothetical protein
LAQAHSPGRNHANAYTHTHTHWQPWTKGGAYILRSTNLKARFSRANYTHTKIRAQYPVDTKIRAQYLVDTKIRAQYLVDRRTKCTADASLAARSFPWSRPRLHTSCLKPSLSIGSRLSSSQPPKSLLTGALTSLTSCRFALLFTVHIRPQVCPPSSTLEC